MMESMTMAIIGASVSIITAFLGYKQGQKKSDAEATQTAFESYNFALESLRKEFEHRINVLQRENDELKQRIATIEKERNEANTK